VNAKPKRIFLVDAQQMAKEFPETFEAPSPSNLSQLQAGDIVKVCDNYERFWVQIVSRRGDIFLAHVGNVLLSGRLGIGDLIQFHACNVFDIDDEPERDDE
jgi:hypothetical protein